MASFSISQADSIGGQGGGGFFRLKNDLDTAKVRILYNGADSVHPQSVHECEVDGKKRWVDCLRGYGDPVDACPFCKAGRYVNIKYFIPLFNIDANTTQIWERGKDFGSKLSSICSRYPDTYSHVFTIERHGKAGYQQTSYEIYEEEKTEGVSLNDFDVQNPVGTVVMVKTAEEMNAYLNSGSFPSNGNTREANEGGGQQYQRRTPAGNSGRREAF